MIVIVSILLIVPLLVIALDVAFLSKTDDVLIANLEDKLTFIVNDMEERVSEQVAVRLQEKPEQSLASILEQSFEDVATPVAERNQGVRLGIYIIEGSVFETVGYLHDYRPPGGEGKERREERIYNETIAGIKAVVAGGDAIVRFGETWDDRFLEYLKPVYVEDELVAVVWAGERMHPIFAKSAKARKTISLALVMVFILGVCATTVASVTMSRRVQRMKDGIIKLEKDFSNLLPEMPGDLGQVASAVNRMALALQEKEQLTKKLERSKRLAVLGRTVTEIAHELRNPVSVVQATAELMESKVKDEELKECLGMINKQLEKQNNLISDLLNFGRPSAVEIGPININDLINEAISVVDPLLEQNNIVLEYDSEEFLPEIAGDKEKLMQVFMNLIMNSIHAMPEGGTLTLDSYIKDDFVCIDVSDTGEGIPQEYLADIFEPFYSRKAGGSGLGLAISKKIIEIHSGKIKVECKDSVTKFTICLPYKGSK